MTDLMNLEEVQDILGLQKEMMELIEELDRQLQEKEEEILEYQNLLKTSTEQNRKLLQQIDLLKNLEKKSTKARKQ